MFRHAWTKVMVVSTCMATAGVLVCTVALVDVVAPTRSVVWFAVRMGAVAATNIPLLAAYVWLCEESEDYLVGRNDRHDASRPKHPCASANGNQRRDSNATESCCNVHRFRRLSIPSNRHGVESLYVRHPAMTDVSPSLLTGRRWCGQ